MTKLSWVRDGEIDAIKARDAKVSEKKLMKSQTKRDRRRLLDEIDLLKSEAAEAEQTRWRDNSEPDFPSTDPGDPAEPWGVGGGGVQNPRQGQPY